MRPLRNRCAVFTAISNNYDLLRRLPENVSRYADCVAFVDDPTPSVQSRFDNWRPKRLMARGLDPYRAAKYYKILCHRVFPQHRYSLWLDGSVQIEFDFHIDKLIDRYLADRDLCIYAHPSRNCVYQEEQACLEQEKDTAALIREQVQRYRRQGYPENAGMVEASVVLRRHTPEVVEFNELWWREIESGSRRDQLSFNYCARALGLEFNVFPETLRIHNGLFSRAWHNHEMNQHESG